MEAVVMDRSRLPLVLEGAVLVSVTCSVGLTYWGLFVVEGFVEGNRVARFLLECCGFPGFVVGTFGVVFAAFAVERFAVPVVVERFFPGRVVEGRSVFLFFVLARSLVDVFHNVSVLV